MKVTQWLLISLSVCSFVAQAEQYYGNGYTIVKETQVQHGNDIDVMVYKSITAEKVKYGLVQLLKGSGWQLADNSSADPHITRLYNQDYPDFKHVLRPIKLSDALQYIAGSAWNLVVDPVNKKVSFELKNNYICNDVQEAICVTQ